MSGVLSRSLSQSLPNSKNQFQDLVDFATLNRRSAGDTYASDV